MLEDVRLFICVLVLVAFPGSAFAQAGVEQEIVAALLPHVRTVVPEGKVRIVPPTTELVPGIARKLAGRSDVTVGGREAAVQCTERKCRALAPYVAVLEIRSIQITDAGAEVTIEIVRPKSSWGAVFMQTDLVYLRRDTSGWRIDRVENIAIT
jgi:hypothetical protein